MIGLALAFIGVLVVVTIAAMNAARTHAESVADIEAEQSSRINLGLLSSELQKYRLLPLVLIEYPDVAAALEAGGGPPASRLNPKLEILAERTDAAVIYLLRPDGLTIAASNWRLPSSFVGQNFSFRPYFNDALRNGGAELFAQGAVSRRPGLFIAQRVASGGRNLGVIVVKVEFDEIEDTWSHQVGKTFLTDENGVIIITSVPDWRFKTLRKLDSSLRRQLQSSRRYGDLDLSPLPLAIEGKSASTDSGTKKVLYRVSHIDTPLDGGTLHYLVPLEPALANANASARALALVVLVIAIIAFGIWWRARERMAMQRTARGELEREVDLRTMELTDANQKLREESMERERAAERLRAAREELAQANRLSYIGQITASVAHEINQPVAAIRAFAENGREFLERGALHKADSNLATIVEITARIGAITAQLRGFARRASKGSEPVDVGAAIDGALMMMRDRLDSSGVGLTCRGTDHSVRVVADRVRLEQVFVNLLQNALDALSNVEDPHVVISVDTEEANVRLKVEDNGPGITDDLRHQLFTPFVTGRPEGLGLGLGIARDIVREFGGELKFASSSLGGAAFEVRLKQA